MFICPICGNVIEMVCASGVVPICCGKEMQPMTCKTIDDMKEKHVPIYEIEDCKVKVRVGEIPHPMTQEHHISWIELVTDKGMQRKNIYPKEEATATFCLCKDEKVIAVYEYCNIHGLWAAINEDHKK